MYIKKIEKFLKNKFKKRQNRKNRFILNNVKKQNYTKKRQKISINKDIFNNLNIFWWNVYKYYIAIFSILIITILFILFGPTFKIKKIEVIKMDNITNMDIAYKAIEGFRWKSILSIEKSDVFHKLTSYQNNIKDIKTSIILPDTYKIVIESYIWIFNTKINEKNFIVTENWSLIPWVNEKLKNIETIKQFDKNKFIDYKKNFDTKYIQKIESITKKVKENIINIEILNIKYYVTERELHIKIKNDTTLIFDLNWDYKEQIEKIVIFNKENTKISNSDIIYIDLRIKNKIFLCKTKEEFICRKNLKNVYSKE